MKEEHSSTPLLPDYFFIMRPLIIMPIWAFCIFGFHRASIIYDSGFDLGFWRIASIDALFILILSLYGLLFGAIYILNQIADYETDKLTPSIWLIASGKFSKKTALIEMMILSIVAIAGSAINRNMFFIFLFTAIVGFIYSMPPIKLSGRPVLDVLADSTIYGITAFALGWIAGGGSVDWIILKLSLPYFFLMAAGALNQAIPDMEDDKATGKITTAVRFGSKKTSAISIISLFIVVLTSLLIRDYICLTMGVFSLPFFFKAFISGKKADYLRSYHIPGPFVILVAALQFPPLLLAVIIIYMGARWYYPWRFGVDYPKVGS